MERREAAHKWYQSWSNTPATIQALRRFREVAGNNAYDNASTLDRIVMACFEAAHYEPELDPGKIYRDKIQAEKKRLNQLARAAHVLALSAGRNETGFMWACDIAESESGVRITRAEHSGPTPLNLVVEKYFLALESALSGKLPELHGGPWTKRFTIGNLISDKAISRGRPVSTETMLAFELAVYLRMHTAGRASDSPRRGQKMPTDGEPCFPVVAAFCFAALGQSDDAESLGRKVRDLGNVGFGKWPQVGNSTSDSKN